MFTRAFVSLIYFYLNLPGLADLGERGRLRLLHPATGEENLYDTCRTKQEQLQNQQCSYNLFVW